MWDQAQLAKQMEPAVGTIYRYLRRRMAEEGRRHQLTPSQVSALRTLSVAGPLRMTELAGRLELTGSACTTMVEGLEKRALVARQLDPDDRRANRVALLPPGEELVGQIIANLYGEMAHAMSKLGEAERHMVLGGLAALAGVLE